MWPKIFKSRKRCHPRCEGYASNKGHMHKLFVDVSGFGIDDLKVYTSEGNIVIEGRRQTCRLEFCELRHIRRRIVTPRHLRITDCTYLSQGILAITVHVGMFGNVQAANKIVKINEGQAANKIVKCNEGQAANNIVKINEGQAANKIVKINEGQAANKIVKCNEGQAANKIVKINEGQAANKIVKCNEGQAANNIVKINEGQAANKIVKFNEGQAANKIETVKEEQGAASTPSTAAPSEGTAQEMGGVPAEVETTEMESSEQPGSSKVVKHIEEGILDEKTDEQVETPPNVEQSVEHNDNSSGDHDSNAQIEEPISNPEQDGQTAESNVEKPAEVAEKSDAKISIETAETPEAEMLDEAAGFSPVNKNETVPKAMWPDFMALMHDEVTEELAESLRVWAELEAIAEEVEREEMIKPIGIWSLCSANCLRGLSKVAETIKNML